MATVTAIRKDKDSGDERAELRRAVSDAQAAKSDADRLRDAIERAGNLAMINRGKLAVATKAVTTAKAEDVRQLAQSIADGGTTSPRQAPAAEATAREAEADVEAARAAHIQLELDLKEAEVAAVGADRAVNVALSTILRPTALRLLEEVQGHRLRLLMAREALNVVARVFDSWDGIAKDAARSTSPSEADIKMSVVARQQWQDAIEALREDADVALPEMQ